MANFGQEEFGLYANLGLNSERNHIFTHQSRKPSSIKHIFDNFKHLLHRRFQIEHADVILQYRTHSIEHCTTVWWLHKQRRNTTEQLKKTNFIWSGLPGIARYHFVFYFQKRYFFLFWKRSIYGGWLLTFLLRAELFGICIFYPPSVRLSGEMANFGQEEFGLYANLVLGSGRNQIFTHQARKPSSSTSLISLHIYYNRRFQIEHADVILQYRTYSI